MEWLNPNPIKLKDRLLSLLIDWLVIIAYLGGLFVVFALLYTWLFGTIFVALDEVGTQMISFLTSVLPVTIAFAWMDYHGGTIGKRKRGLKVMFQRKSFGAALLRNTLKFLPWQLGHMTAIHAIYQLEAGIGLVLLGLLTGLISFLMLMALWQSDKRHIADRVACTQVQYVIE